jgi:hypothetical protein
MWEFLHPFFTWSEGTWIGEAMRESQYLFPVISTIHLLGLTILLGALSVFNLRLFGLVLKHEQISILRRHLTPWMRGSLAVMLVTGWLLFASEAEKCYQSDPFAAKMIFLAAALVFHLTLYRKATKSDDETLWHKMAAFASITLWFSVGLAGRAIGYF